MRITTHKILTAIEKLETLKAKYLTEHGWKHAMIGNNWYWVKEDRSGSSIACPTLDNAIEMELS